MSDHGKERKGLQKSSARCHHKELNDNAHGVTKPAIGHFAYMGSMKYVLDLI